MSDLPEGWSSRPIGELLESNRSMAYGVLKPGEHTPGGVLLLKGYQVRDGYIDASEQFLIGHSLDQEFARTRLAGGEIVLTVVGSVGRSAIVPEALRGANVSRAIAVLPVERTLAPWVQSALRCPDVQRDIAERTTGTAQPVLNLGEVRDISIPLPPVAEQRRIVAKLEELLARSRRAKEAIDAIPPLLETLRRSILAAAFRGDLTADWREQHPDVEPAEKLLARIRVERRKKWEEAELARLKAKGKAPTDDRWKEKYREPEPVDASGLPELPEGWGWASVEEVCFEQTVGHVGKTAEFYCDTSEGVPFLRSQNVRPTGFSRLGLTHITRTFHAELPKSRLNGGELLIVRVGANLGDACVFPQDAGEANCANIVVSRPLDYQLARYAAAFLASPFGKSEIERLTGGSAQGVLNVASAARIRIPIPPAPERDHVTEVALGANARIERFASALTQTKSEQERLAASLLSKAFRGELVPQDPNDEPASALLARLKAATAVAEQAGAKKLGKKRSSKAHT